MRKLTGLDFRLVIPGGPWPKETTRSLECFVSGQLPLAWYASRIPPPCVVSLSIVRGNGSANVSLHWALRGTGAAFALSSAASGWLALGFSLSGGAEGSDVVIGLSPGEPPPGTDPATLHPNVGTYFIKGNSAQGLERTEGRLNITQPLMQTAQGVTLLRY